MVGEADVLVGHLLHVRGVLEEGVLPEVGEDLPLPVVRIALVAGVVVGVVLDMNVTEYVVKNQVVFLTLRLTGKKRSPHPYVLSTSRHLDRHHTLIGTLLPLNFSAVFLQMRSGTC